MAHSIGNAALETQYGNARIKLTIAGQYLRWTLLSDRQQADSVRSCRDIVTHGFKYGKQDSSYINSTYEAIQQV
ncbi:hypothetical protein QUB19_09180 [Microcoleus sp. B4-C5]|uniref:hypothetical protein n=1 Tax=unclassified Microcoleus TaxID=2642155 RepID=UPI002FD18C51